MAVCEQTKCRVTAKLVMSVCVCVCMYSDDNIWNVVNFFSPQYHAFFSLKCMNSKYMSYHSIVSYQRLLLFYILDSTLNYAPR